MCVPSIAELRADLPAGPQLGSRAIERNYYDRLLVNGTNRVRRVPACCKSQDQVGMTTGIFGVVFQHLQLGRPERLLEFLDRDLIRITLPFCMK